MRNRKVQREMRRSFGKEEKLDRVDFCGIRDPTPYEAVNNLIRREKAMAIARARAVVAARDQVDTAATVR